eukprot:gnl/MRDRNA2_/MRDRNA2_149305_c0_seq1.p1 gnl/MRDRNA2_/MRDRNA2_149305_c0~~gnl/MRDRNA2_/MRDRNA2_149305_c0_seq1.p1  ORF type:complete len:451 (-),score=63.11 gnl/MRDRNA2_/MRDRNA2_149305_c0_seq1:30-1382(-)
MSSISRGDSNQAFPDETAPLNGESNDLARVRSHMLGDFENSSADVQFKEDVFHSVVVAAFGGVKLNLERTESMLVHPSFMFVFCMGLFCIQMSIITFLRLDMDLTDEFIKYEEGHHWHVHGNLIVMSKLMMMLVVQLLLFEDMRGVFQLLAFVLNPTSWSDIQRPDPDEMHLKSAVALVWTPWCLAPFAIGALIMKVTVAYFVCVDSVSIILATESVRDAIFESLAMVFVVELSTVWWEVFSAAFHLESFMEYEFKVASDEFRLKQYEKSWIKIPEYFKFLHRGHGARKLEVVVTYLFIFWIYDRQLHVVVFALHTNILPVARDVCTLWRYQTGKVEFLHRIAAVVRWGMRYILVYDPEEDIMDRCDPDKGGYCDEKYERMRNSDLQELWIKYPGLMWGGTIGIWLFFILPQIVYCSSKYIKQLVRVENVVKPSDSKDEEITMPGVQEVD